MTIPLQGENVLHDYPAVIDGCEYQFEQPEVTGKDLLIKAGKIPVECHSIYQKLRDCDFELVRMDEVVDLRNSKIEHFQVKEPIVFHYLINKDPETTESKHLTASEILQLAGIDPNESYLVQLQSHGPKIIYAFEPHKPIQMVCTGLHFISEPWVELVDIEEYGKTCKEVPPAKHYRIKVDKNYHIVTSPYISGKSLIELEHKQPVQNWDAYKFYSNQPKPKKVGHDEIVDLTEKCLVRFVLQPREQKDGRVNRKDFTLPEEDIEFLNNLGLHWEALSNAGLWLIIYDYSIPEGYNTSTVQIALMISPNYPAAEIDMAYFFPILQKNNGKAINAISYQMIDGKSFQRWSRHREPGDWRPGIDNVQTHLTLVDNWVLNDLKR
jgi:hypothetical protein